MAKQNRYVVDLAGLKLSPEDHRGVAAAIQGAVLTFLAAKYELPSGQIKTMDGVGVEGMFIGEGGGSPKK